MENEITENKKRKRKGSSSLEKVQKLEGKSKKIEEEKQKIEYQEQQMQQDKAIGLKEVYDLIFEALEIPIENIIFSSKNSDEVIFKVKNHLGLTNDRG